MIFNMNLILFELKNNLVITRNSTFQAIKNLTMIVRLLAKSKYFIQVQRLK